MSVTVSAIRTDDDLKAALERLSEIFAVEADAPEAEERDVLAVLIEAYEKKHHPIGNDVLVNNFREYLRKLEIRPGDLVPMIGHKTRVSDILHGRRRLTVAMMRRLHDELGIPYDVLMTAGPSEGVGTRQARATRGKTIAKALP